MGCSCEILPCDSGNSGSEPQVEKVNGCVQEIVYNTPHTHTVEQAEIYTTVKEVVWL